MSITDTVSTARETAIKRISEAKTDRTAKQVEELRTENRLLRDELAENRSERKQVLDLLDKAQISVGGRSKRRFKVLRLVAAGGAVYAVATQTGAVERIKGWIDSIRGKSQDLGSDFASKGSEMTHSAADAIEQTGRKVKQSGRKLEETGRKLDQTAGRVAQSDGTER
jgi:hypothetical protein